MVIGLFGTWGTGKTSLMRLIEAELHKNIVCTIWFDPWMHQFDENPIVAFAHSLVNKLNRNKYEEGKKILTTIATELGSNFLKSTIGLTAHYILKFGKIYEEERFQVRESRVRLREYFEKIIDQVKGSKTQPKRLVIFIDDLDRCMPEESLMLLEALKLYLNISGCVYFIGVDRVALEQSILHQSRPLPEHQDLGLALQESIFHVLHRTLYPCC